MKKLLFALTLLLFAGPVLASLRVAATVPNLGMLASEIGGEAVTVTVLAPPDRDPHYLEARPSMMAALRRADLVVAVGAELEVGWLPAALQGAHNPRVREGRQGYFEGAAHTRLIDAGQPADRALGDVHVAGNPHFYFDPLRMAEVGHALAERLGSLRPEHAAAFRANAERFEHQARERVERWHAGSSREGVVFYHKDADYLAELLEVEVLGYLEPLPGIPPTARHLRELVSSLRGRDGIILYADFQPARAAETVARELGWNQRQLPMQVQEGAGAAAYLDMIQQWVEEMQH